MLRKKYKIIHGYFFKRNYFKVSDYDICENCPFFDRCGNIEIKGSLTLNDICPPTEEWERGFYRVSNHIYIPDQDIKR